MFKEQVILCSHREPYLILFYLILFKSLNPQPEDFGHLSVFKDDEEVLRTECIHTVLTLLNTRNNKPYAVKLESSDWDHKLSRKPFTEITYKWNYWIRPMIRWVFPLLPIKNKAGLFTFASLDRCKNCIYVIHTLHVQLMTAIRSADPGALWIKCHIYCMYAAWLSGCYYLFRNNSTLQIPIFSASLSRQMKRKWNISCYSEQNISCSESKIKLLSFTGRLRTMCKWEQWNTDIRMKNKMINRLELPKKKWSNNSLKILPK